MKWRYFCSRKTPKNSTYNRKKKIWKISSCFCKI